MADAINNIEVRRAGRGDRDVIVSLLAILYKGDAGKHLGRIVEEYADSPDHIVLLAIDAGHAMGTLIGSYRLDIDYECRAGLIDALVVEEQHRRRGAGRALVREFAKWATSRDCAMLQVINPNQGFFETMGFRLREMRFCQVGIEEIQA